MYGPRSRLGHVARYLNTFSSRHPMEAPYEIWLQTALCFFRTRSLKMLNLSDLGQRSMNDLDLGLS